ncbi:bone morphogenetic protein 8a [Nothobranchius furzeri]|uniref:Bone morphogenetic protein 8a n=2 Tax=Nothobranchius TaxID=28779 RepID=A0A9D3BLU2_NOTFU|nr:bone morphogenetic protein 8a [Nothobranchius furzeri]
MTLHHLLHLQSASTLLLLLLLSVSLWSQQAEAVVHSSFRRLSGREKKEMQKEILNILGLPGRPRPHPPLRPPSSAPLFMLDLYHAMSAEDENENEVSGPGIGRFGAAAAAQVSYAAMPTLSTHTPPLGAVVSEADTVMSFVNLGEYKPSCQRFLFLSLGCGGDAVGLQNPWVRLADAYLPVSMKVKHPLPSGFLPLCSSGVWTVCVCVGGGVLDSDDTFNGCLFTSRELELVLLDMQSVPAGQEGWLAFDVTSASNHWLLHPRSNLGIRLYVETEDDRSLSAAWIGLVGRRGPGSKQPFMVTFFRENQVPCRPPRAVKPHPRRKKHKYDLPVPIINNRSAASKGEPCKKHELYVSFSDLGWKDWVLAPTGYSAYYCDGECIYPLGSCMNATNHALIQLVVHLMKPEEVPTACCAPTKLSPISVLFYDDNNNVILKKHRNMVVKTCGCL